MLKPDVPLGDRGNMVFMGTSVAAGTGRAVVVATAMATELGRIAGLIEEADADKGTPLQRKLDAFGKILVWAALGIVALLFGLGYQRGTHLLELTMTAVSLAVAAVPEGLPGRGDGRALRRRAAHGPPPRARATTGGGGDPRVDRRHLHGQDGDADRRRNDRTRALRGGTALRGHGGRLRARAARSASKASRSARATRGAAARIRHRDSRVQQRAVVQKAGTWTTVGDPTEGALLVAGAKAGGDRAASTRRCRHATRCRSIPTASGARSSGRCRTERSARSSTARRARCWNAAPALYTGGGTRPLTDQDRTEILALTSATWQTRRCV